MSYCSADADEDGTCDGLDDCVGAYDDCGVCNGDGSSCQVATLSLGAFDASGTLEVLYDFGSDVGGFQFDVSGLALTGAAGGAAGCATGAAGAATAAREAAGAGAGADGDTRSP